MAPVLRFAPSPTGLIHIGNARTALLNALVARREGGTFVLRFDDTDVERSRTEYADQTEADLAWLGIPPDLVVRQSDRMALYAEAAERLKESGRLYPCYETADELERRRRIQLTRGRPPIYDRAALALTEEDRRALEEEGRRPHWRFRLEPRIVAWTDHVRGPSHVDCASLSDPVLVREDGTYLYTLPSVVDDIALGITDVVRGEDHVTNTGVQIQVFEALGGKAPAFGHHNLLTTMSGEGLSKRSGALSLRQLAEDGYEPLAVAALAVLVGSSESVRPVADLAELASLVDLAHISRAPARFDESELDALNARFVHAMSYDVARPRLEALHIAGGEAFWNAVRANLGRFGDALRWWGVVEGPVVPEIEDRALVEAALGLLPPAPWDGTTWKTWTEAVRAQTGLKGRALFLPLRLALTGLDHGPELAALLPLIGPDRARARLAGEVI
jgi:glutamyl-tRNA synthetase